MDNQTLEQLSVAVRIIPYLTQDQYTGIMGVLKAYYGHAGRPGMVGGSAPRSGPISGSVQSPVRGNNGTSPPDALVSAMGHKQWAGIVHKVYQKHGQISSELLAKEAALQGKKETRVEEWDKVMQKALKSDLYSGDGKHSSSTVYKLKSDKAVAKPNVVAKPKEVVKPKEVAKPKENINRNKLIIDNLLQEDKNLDAQLKKLSDAEIKMYKHKLDCEQGKTTPAQRDKLILEDFRKVGCTRHAEIEMSRDALREKSNMRKLDLLRSDNPPKIGKTTINFAVGDRAKEIQSVYEKTTQIFDASLYPPNGVVPPLTLNNSIRETAQYNGDESKIEGLRNKANTTIIHEVAHHLEHRSKGGSVKEAAYQFLKSRTNDGKMKLTRMGAHGTLVWLDKFVHPYMGRKYDPLLRSTEIISVGMTELLTNTKEFTTKDPEYVNHLLDLINGKFKKGKYERIQYERDDTSS